MKLKVLKLLGIKSLSDLAFFWIIFLTGPLLMFVAFGTIDTIGQEGISLSFLSHLIGLMAAILCSVSAFYSLVSLFLKEKALKTEINREKFNGKFSVIIPARNEEKVIQDILKDLQRQTYKSFEVIVLAHNCTDRTYELALKFQNQDKRIKAIELNGPPGKGFALNNGIEYSTGEIIVVFDADNRIPPDFLEILSSYFPYYDAVQTKIESKNPSINLLTQLQDIEFSIFLDIFQKIRQNFNLPALLGGTGTAIKKEVLKKIGGYDETAFCEDLELGVRLTTKKYKIGWCTQTFVLDEKTPWWNQFFRQRSRWVKGHFQVIGRYFLHFWRPAEFHYMLSPLFMILAHMLTITFWLFFFLKLPITAYFLSRTLWLVP